MIFCLFILLFGVRQAEANVPRADSLVRLFSKMTVEERSIHWKDVIIIYRNEKQWDKLAKVVPQLNQDLPKIKKSFNKFHIVISYAIAIDRNPKLSGRAEDYIREAEAIVPTLEKKESEKTTLSLLNYYFEKYKDAKNLPMAEKYIVRQVEYVIATKNDEGIYGIMLWGLRQFYSQEQYFSKTELVLAHKILDYANKNFKDKMLAEAWVTMGEVLVKFNETEKGYDLISKGMTIIEQHSKPVDCAGMMNDVASVFFKNGNFALALRYYRKAFNPLYQNILLIEQGKAKGTLQNYIDVAQFALNISEPFLKINQPDSTLHYAQLGVKYAKLGQHNFLITVSKSRIASAYWQKKDYANYIPKAVDFLKDYEKYNPQKNPLTFAATYLNLHKAYWLTEKVDSAKYFFKKAQKIYAQNPSLTVEQKITKYRNEVLYYREVEQDMFKAFNSSDSLVTYLDSLIKIKDKLKISDALMRYDTESRENQIKNLNQEKQLADLQSQHKNFLLIGIAAVLLLSVGVVGLLFARNRSKQRTNQLLASQNEAIQKMNSELAEAFQTIQVQHEEISNAYEELNTTLEQVQEQKTDIEIKNRKIEDSIHYAKRIQEAILPNLDVLKNYFTAYWIYYHPRDIVSGDFYWYAIKGDTVFVAVVDCTGHGVPGAFMSVVGFNLLNEIINEPEDRTVDAILTELNRRVTLTLRQDRDSDSKDGMDVVLISYQKANHTLTYAGAGRPFYLLKGGHFIEIKANKYPIGGGQHEDKTFDVHRLEVHQGDKIYLFTDGITDQFGGPEKRKFTPKRLQEFIITHPNLSASDLEDDFTRQFDTWRRGRTQIDDLTLMMIEV